MEGEALKAAAQRRLRQLAERQAELGAQAGRAEADKAAVAGAAEQAALLAQAQVCADAAQRGPQGVGSVSSA
eukprot:359182-Chlamydomonas_euryale.AAC.2